MMKKRKSYHRILVTSALPYANGPLHLGHIAGAYLPADIYVRYQRAKGRDVVYICGSDEHGVPITVTADNENVTPQKVVDRYHAMNHKSFQRLGIDFDHYSRTSLPRHHITAQDFFSILNDQGDLIVKSSEQFYSEKTERFLPDRYVEGICPHCNYEKARGDQCDQCGKWLEPGELKNPRSNLDGSIPVLKKTKHWYFPMGRFAEEWKSWFESQDWKENVRNYCFGWYKEGLSDRPITRDLHWGVPVPLPYAKGKVLYVWFDAPIGYISATKEWAEKIGNPECWKNYWLSKETKLVHFIGKDNIVFHAILFPMILMRVGEYVLPDAIPANEYLTIEGRKISTSQNYAIWLKDYLEVFPPDPLRYTLAANAPETKDTDFSWKQFQSRNNDELADILGNFVNRTLTFIHRYYNSQIPSKGSMNDMDKTILKKIDQAPSKIGDFIEKFEIRNACKEFMDICRFANKYFNDRAPWETRKSDPGTCETTLNICIQITKTMAVLVAPFLPFTHRKLMKMLRLESGLSWDEAARKEIPEGHKINQPELLFKKIEDKAIEREIENLKKLEDRSTSIQLEQLGNKIDLLTFKKIELRTAKVISAEVVSGAEHLLKLQVDLGSEKRQIIAGVAESYSPGQIVGKTIIMVCNLKTVRIHDNESQGMLLAVKSKNGFSLVSTDHEVIPGLKVS